VSIRAAGAGLLLAALIAGCGGGHTASTTTHRAAPSPASRTGIAHPPETTTSPYHVVIGHSVRGRPILAVRLGPAGAPHRMLVVGCIHGNEQAGIAVARRLTTVKPPPGTAIWVIPVLNPDGAAADTRQNADQVDLNRNFPWHWQPIGTPGDLQYSGTRALSEPESRAAHRFILRIRPNITVWFHQPLHVVDLSGGNPAIEREFASLVGLPVERLTRYPGSAVSWTNTVIPGGTSFVVELPPGSLTGGGIDRYVHAILTVARR
jgi:murein peptide amidase A